MWTIGQKKEFGTYNANMIFDENGENILMVFGIAQHHTLEELGERDADGLAISRQVVNDHNTIAALREAGKKMAQILKWELNEGNLKDSETLAALEAWEAANK